MNSSILNLIKSFLLLFLFTCIGIFLHELSHHLSGIPSILSLSRNYPLVPISEGNKIYALIDNLVGPAANLFLAYIGLLIYKAFINSKILSDFGTFLGISNSFLALSGAVINLIVDLVSGKMGNDLEIASSILGISVFILPLVFSLLSLIPLKTFWWDSKKIAPNKISFAAIIFAAWLTAGIFLMTLDSIFNIRIR